jgi:hypothetical protein
MSQGPEAADVEPAPPITSAEAQIIAQLRAIRHHIAVLATLALVAALAGVIVAFLWLFHFAQRPQ